MTGLLFLLLQANGVQAQCTSFISTFPYNEGFETSPAWVAGGTNSDWAWGTPAHPYINSAGSGTKCWSTGGLTGSFYEYSAQSWLMSPCFDFSSLSAPWISFKIFWETEYKWDGLVMQYSINGGTTWLNLGAYGDPEDCLNDNWFNYNNVGWLGVIPKHGWSGRTDATSGSCQGGNGSTQWIEAKHCMVNLAGRPSVRFRFLFGSGTTCNDFDGIAIDDIHISDAAADAADFSYTCDEAGVVSFTNLSSGCATNLSWNFGDPASGGANTSTLEDPSHTFAPGGNYTVTLTGTNSCGASGSISKVVSFVPANVTGTNASCHGLADGSATVSTGSATGPFTYEWNTVPPITTATATGLQAGTYTVSVSSPSACASSATITIEEPVALETTVNTNPSCTDICNGSVNAAAAGGTAPYTYNWTSLGTAHGYTGTVCAGTYTVTVTDANGCTGNPTVADVNTIAPPLITCPSVTICMGSGMYLNATGGNTYSWSPATGLSAPTGANVFANPSTTTGYVLTGTSVDGCSNSIDVLVTVDPTVAPVAAFNWLPENPSVFNPFLQFNNLSSGENTYTWDFSGLAQSHDVHPGFIFPDDSSGTYQVCLLAVNAVGCTDTTCQGIQVDGFPSIYMPNAFTPNGDGMNDLFFPVVRDIDLKDFEWMVFDRWGQMILYSKDFTSTWDGTSKGIYCKADVYVWKIRYIEKTTGVNREMVGQVTLVR